MKKKKQARKRTQSSRYLTSPLGKDFVRGFIPHCIKPTDNANEVAALFGVHPATARMWIRILKGPQISRKGKIINKWERPDFGATPPNRKGTR